MMTARSIGCTLLAVSVLGLSVPAAADESLPRTDSLLTQAQCAVIQTKLSTSLFAEYGQYRSRLRAPQAQINALYGVLLNFNKAELTLIQQYAGAPGDAAQFERVKTLVEANVAARKKEFDKVVCPHVEDLVPPQPKAPPHDWWQSAPPRDRYYYSRWQIRPAEDECVLSVIGSDGDYHSIKSFPIVRESRLQGPSAEDMRRGRFVVTYTIAGEKRHSVAMMDLAVGKMSWANPGEQLVYAQRGATSEQLRALAESEARKQLAQAYPECAARD
jgi:hypothetical protein